MRQLRSVVSELLTALTSTLNDERASAKECLSRAAALLQTAGEAGAPRRPTKGGLAAWQVRTLTSHVETNLDKPIRSSELATVVRLNPAYFCRVFRESFGEPPLQYISRGASSARRAHAVDRHFAEPDSVRLRIRGPSTLQQVVPPLGRRHTESVASRARGAARRRARSQPEQACDRSPLRSFSTITACRKLDARSETECCRALLC